jgi:hypothetical protein
LPTPFLLVALIVFCAGCTAQLGVEFSSPKIQDCVPGSVSRPCNQLN